MSRPRKPHVAGDASGLLLSNNDCALLFQAKQDSLILTKPFILGASIKNAGKKAFHLIPIDNPSARDEMIWHAEEVWNQAIVLL
jgi:hypothetical protein